MTVDCQHGAGNVGFIQAETVCVIDHHIQEKTGYTYTHIEPYLGSCSTVVWRLLKEASFDFEMHRDVSTALYYGLYTDTNNFSEVFHPMDRDMLEDLHFDEALIRRLKGSNLTLDELLVASRALGDAVYDESNRNLIYEAAPCDPNILGFISDLTLQVDRVDTCVGYSRIGGGVKLSLRSATREVMANEFAAFITSGHGSGGGTKEKAGGFVRFQQEPEDILAFFSNRVREYFASYDKVIAHDHPLDTSQMSLYKKKRITVGYVRLMDIYPKGTEICVRTLEGDAAFMVSEDTYIMIGIQGETYPIPSKKFAASYEALEGEFKLDPSVLPDDFYAPTVKDRLYQKSIELLPYARPCRSTQQAYIFARPVDKPTKVFTPWYTEGYMLGKPGDWLAVRHDDRYDAYIIDARIFSLTYEPVDFEPGR